MRRSRGAERGVTLLEVLVSVSILALIGILAYGALDGMSKARSGLEKIGDRYHQGRTAISRMTRELQSAFISGHQPVNQALVTRTTAFIGKGGTTQSRVDFTSFASLRIERNTQESDQVEIGYFLSRDTENDKVDLVRREDRTLDMEPDRGGIVQVVAEDVAEFTLSFYDPTTSRWIDSWDSTQVANQGGGRLPSEVKIILLLNHGEKDKPVKFQTKVAVPMQLPLSFAIPR